jgi:CRP-like cAMP-binding protein
MAHRLLANKLLAALPPEVAGRLLPDLEPVAVSVGQTLAVRDEGCAFLHFPTTCLVSLEYLADDGQAVAVGTVGSEGLIDIGVLLSGRATNHAIVQFSGDAIRVPTDVFLPEMAAMPALQAAVLGFARALLAHIAQTSACNQLHSLKQRFCRWLLVTGDSLNCARIPATQEVVGRLLGVRRESINAVASTLHEAGLVDWARGSVSIVDRDAVERAACECQRIIRRQYGWATR